MIVFYMIIKLFRYQKVYSEELEEYIGWKQPKWLISDKELRLKAGLEPIIKEVH